MEKTEKALKDEVLVNILQDDYSTAREKESAFNKLYANHGRQLLFFFLQRRVDKETAEDLRIATFQTVYEKVGSYSSDKGAFSTWMYKVGLNKLIDLKRKEKSEVVSIDLLSENTKNDDSYNGAFEFQIQSNLSNPHHLLVREERKKNVNIVVDSIENDFIREVTKKNLLEEKSFEEIADEMGLKNNSSLRVGVLRGKAILEERLITLKYN